MIFETDGEEMTHRNEFDEEISLSQTKFRSGERIHNFIGARFSRNGDPMSVACMGKQDEATRALPCRAQSTDHKWNDRGSQRVLSPLRRPNFRLGEYRAAYRMRSIKQIVNGNPLLCS